MASAVIDLSRADEPAWDPPSGQIDLSGADEPAPSRPSNAAIDLTDESSSVDKTRGSETFALVPRLAGTRPIIRLLASGEVTVGRKAEAQIQLNYAFISRRHARLIVEAGRAYIVPLCRDNLVTVNGEPVARGARIEMRAGDAVSFVKEEADFAYRVERRAASDEAPRPADDEDDDEDFLAFFGSRRGPAPAARSAPSPAPAAAVDLTAGADFVVPPIRQSYKQRTCRRAPDDEREAAPIDLTTDDEPRRQTPKRRPDDADAATAAVKRRRSDGDDASEALARRLRDEDRAARDGEKASAELARRLEREERTRRDQEETLRKRRELEASRALAQRLETEDRAASQRRQREAADRKKTGVLKLDFSIPAQSLLGIAPHVVDQQIRTTVRGPDATIATYCFKTMVEREQEHFDDYICFYHAYNYAALLYEVQGVILRGVQGHGAAGPPCVRLFEGGFRKYPSVAALVRAFPSIAGQDHNPEYRRVAIAASMSLFGGGTEAPPLTCFSVGYGGGDPPNYRNILAGILDKLGAGSRQGLLDELVAIGERYRLPCGPYRGGGVGAPGVGTGAALAGHMLQVFVRKDVARDFAYPCQPMGVPIRSDMVAYARRSPAAGQARIFVPPDRFGRVGAATDFRKPETIVHHYAASPEQCSASTAAAGVKTRGAMLQELRQTLMRHGVIDERGRSATRDAMRRRGSSPESYRGVLSPGGAHAAIMAAMGRGMPGMPAMPGVPMPPAITAYSDAISRAMAAASGRRRSYGRGRSSGGRRRRRGG